MGNTPHESGRTDDWRARTETVGRRALLQAAGLSAAVALGSGVTAADGAATAAASEHGDGNIDPIFGRVSAERSPCLGDASEDCFEAFPEGVRPDHEVEMHIDLPELLLLVAEEGLLSDVTTASINEAVADGEVEDEVLHKPNAVLEVSLPEGGTERVTVREVAHLLAEMAAFHFEPAGLRVEPGDVVLFTAESPDHAVTAFHERHGRQNRVPDGIGPISSPIVPVGGHWLYRFEEAGVYDLYCPPHGVFGMVMSVVCTADDVPERDVENTGRPPEARNLLPAVFGGLDPNIPGEMAALSTEALSPENVVDEGSVSWEAVVAEHRSDA
jgi:plastocyanin